MAIKCLRNELIKFDRRKGINQSPIALGDTQKIRKVEYYLRQNRKKIHENKHRRGKNKDKMEKQVTVSIIRGVECEHCKDRKRLLVYLILSDFQRATVC